MSDVKVRALSAKEERFCQEYAADPKSNGTQAAIAAGYSTNPASAGRQATRLLRNSLCVARINELRNEQLAESGFSKESVRAFLIRKLMAIVSTNVTDIVHVSSPESPTREDDLAQLAELNGGQSVLDLGETLVVPTSALSLEQRAAVKCFKVSRDVKGVPTVDLQLHDVLASAKLLAELVGIKDVDGGANVVVSISDAVKEIEGRKLDEDDEDDGDDREADGSSC